MSNGVVRCLVSPRNELTAVQQPTGPQSRPFFWGVRSLGGFHDANLYRDVDTT
jgi:hypothetical protein